jgi:hypothetical protein
MKGEGPGIIGYAVIRRNFEIWEMQDNRKSSQVMLFDSGSSLGCLWFSNRSRI